MNITASAMSIEFEERTSGYESRMPVGESHQSRQLPTVSSHDAAVYRQDSEGCGD